MSDIDDKYLYRITDDVLLNYNKITELRLIAKTKIIKVNHLTKLKNISIMTGNKILDSQIRNCTNIETMICHDPEMTDLNTLTKLKELILFWYCTKINYKVDSHDNKKIVNQKFDIFDEVILFE